MRVLRVRRCVILFVLIVVSGCATSSIEDRSVEQQEGFSIEQIRKAIDSAGVEIDKSYSSEEHEETIFKLKKVGQFNVCDGGVLFLTSANENNDLFMTFSIMINLGVSKLDDYQLLFIANELNSKYLRGSVYVSGQNVVYRSSLNWHEKISAEDELINFLQAEQEIGEDFIATIMKSTW